MSTHFRVIEENPIAIFRHIQKPDNKTASEGTRKENTPIGPTLSLLLTFSKDLLSLLKVIQERGPAMPIISAKRQITLPKELCDQLGINPGDEVDILECGGKITVLKKVKGASAGILRGRKIHAQLTDKESLQSEIERKQPAQRGKGKAA
jgi:AbrB family looped-hinge helix DNA binding protein